MGRVGSRGVAIVIKHVHTFEDRHGKTRSYLRVPGMKAVSLPGEPGSPAFMKAYNSAVANMTIDDKRKSNAKPRSLRDLIEHYYLSPKFKGKSDRTRHVEKLIFERFMKEHANKSAVTIETRHIDLILGKMADRPAAAMDLRKKLKLLFTLAIKLGWRRDDPTAATDTYELGSWHTWEDDEIEAFENKWAVGTRQRLAFDLLIFTGQRSGDVRRMLWTDVKANRIKVVQSKTGADLWIPLHPDLKPSLDAFRKDIGTMVLTEFARPFSEKGFGNWVADAIDDAKLPERCVTHGIRKAAARRLAEAGCTAHEIASITGHKSIKEVQRYTEAADRTTMAENAMGKVAAAKGGTSGSQTNSQTEV